MSSQRVWPLAPVLLLAPFVSTPSQAALPPLIPREVLFADHADDNPELSPDGRYLAWGRRGEDGVVNLWVRACDGDSAWQVTHDQARGIRHGTWTGDSRRLLFVQDRDGDENLHLWAVDVRGGKARDLTPFPRARVENVMADPRHPETVLIGLNRRDPTVFDVHRVNLVTGEVTLDTENPGDVVDWTTDGEHRIRACTALRKRDGATVLRTRESPADPWRDIVAWTMNDAVNDRAQKIIGFLDEHTLLVQTWAGVNTAQLVRMDARDGRVLEVLAQDSRCDPWNVYNGAAMLPQVLLSPDGSRLRAAAFEYLKPEWKVLDPAVRADFAALTALANGATLLLAGADTADRRWLVGLLGDRTPGRYLLWDRTTRRATPLFDIAPAFSHWTLAPMETPVIRASDGLALPCYLTLPPGIPATHLPLVVNPHGGPWFRDNWGFNPEVQWLANRGYAVLQVEFRASTGFGKRHLDAGNREFGPGKVQGDLVDAVRWAIARGIADPKRIGIMGWSFGGYSTLAALAFRPEIFACGVDGVGPANLGSLIESFPPYWESRRMRWIARMGDVTQDDELNRRLSPIFHVDAIRAPLLIGHGSNDPRVQLVESERLVSALREKGGDVSFIVYPDEGHGFLRPENNRDFYGRAEEFLARHLGGRAEPWREVAGATAEVR